MCLPVKPFQIEKEWVHAGLKCAVVLAREQGHRCGYVRVPPGHPVWGQDENDFSLEVHGGITFAAAESCVEEDGRGWWPGFDCHHCEDRGTNPDVPQNYHWKSLKAKESWTYENKDEARTRLPWEKEEGHYWTLGEVQAEAEQLAEQLAKFPVGEPKEIGGICVLCGTQFWGLGDDAAPVAEGRCCHACYWKQVMMPKSKELFAQLEKKAL